MTTADLLTHFETCDRKGYWSKQWQRHRLDATTLLRRAITAGVTETEREDYGVVAGETAMDLAGEPGMEMPSSRHLYESVVHHATLADVLTSAIRRPGSPAWVLPPPARVAGAPWASGAFLDPSGTRLRRIVLATAWNDDRHYSEMRSWHTQGEMAAYRLPMTIVVLVLGSHRDGRRSGPWTRGFLHPQNHKLRFRKKSKATFETFSDKWESVWREDREIPTWQWLQAMMDDDVLRDVCFTVDIPLLPNILLPENIESIAERKLARLAKLTETPEKSLSVCDRPPCPFKGCCWSEKEYEPCEKAGFVAIDLQDRDVKNDGG